MNPTGGINSTSTARFSACCPSFGVLRALALHIAHPCPNAGIVHTQSTASNPRTRALPLRAFIAIPYFYFTPNCKIRPASGKKKKYMITKQPVTAITSIHRMIAFSNFKCMK
jgi:hypothetical protein